MPGFFVTFAFAFARCEWVLGSHSDIYRLQRSCSKIMFSPACVKNSLYGRVYPSMHWGRYSSRQVHLSGQVHPPGTYIPPGRYILPMQVHSPARYPPARYPPGQVQPPRQTGTAGDGTHPTGMHSCLHVSTYSLRG